MSDKDQRFVAYWKDKRQYKWRYIFRFGVLLWGVPVGLGTYSLFLLTAKAQQTFEFSELIVRASVAIITGLILAYIQFRASDNHYLKLISYGEYHEEP